MSNADFLGRAIETVKKAIETDTAGEYEKAYQLYYSARESLTRELKSMRLTFFSGALYAGPQMWDCEIFSGSGVLIASRGEEPEVQGYD